jgi:O-antigen/teichoic acid export membrane protein
MIPFALAAIFARVYSYIDSILLSKLMGDREVGWYSIPYKITYAFQFIPLALVAALYPKFSEYFVENKNKLAYTLERSIKYLLIIVFPIVVGISILARDIVLSLYTTEYLNSVLPLQILLIGLIFSFISFPLGSFLNACNKQISQTVIVFFIMVINIISNLILIPRLGVVGAALSALVGNFCLVLFSFFVVPKIAKVSYSFIIKNLVQVILSAGVMGLAVWYTNLHFHYIIAILIGGIVYVALLFVFRVITKEQLKEAYLLINKKTPSS